MNISASSYGAWHLCNRYWYLSQLLRIERARESGPAAFGKLFHEGLAAWWTHGGNSMPWCDPDEPLVHALRAIAEASRHIDTDAFDVAKAEVMMVAYHARYFELEFHSADGGDGGDGVERAFDIPLRDENGRTIEGWRVVGRKDAIKRFADRRIKVCEHKTSGSPIHVGADYWDRVKVDMQISIYVDAARYLGFDTSEALYDVSRRPDLRPLRKTPDEKRRMTKGKGCPHCGGRKGGKSGAAQGTGRIMVRTSVDGDGRPLSAPMDVEVTCTSCDGTGWHDAPRLDAKQRDEDESVDEYRARVAEEIASDPDAYFRMATIPRDEDAILESRADLVATTGVIGAMVNMAHDRSHGNLHAPEARRMFSRNTRACLSVYGARCQMLDICSGAVPNPIASPLYRIRPRTTGPR